ncbi:hypothetical protein [Streptomyces sp. HPF1205]|uniref:hypothetical protein n=1 Tax=Streptomyces sp. HPF1205 TaxID=2873262 RepID=UPI001CED13F1|nr:hypothetical protein [Streptomyces sp. HPF1205]
MTRRAKAFAVLPAAALAAALLAGCGSHGSSAGPAGGTPSAPTASELAHMQKLVDDADSAAAKADADATGDR